MTYLPANNLDYPVLIHIGDSVGSGFYLSLEKEVFLVTAKHVLVSGDGSPRGKELTFTSYANRFSHKVEFKGDITPLIANSAVRHHMSSDVSVIKMGEKEGAATVNLTEGLELTTPLAEGVGITGVPPDLVRMFKDVEISNHAYIFGYPISIGSPGQLEPTKPLIRKGAVAGLNTTNNTIIIDAPAYQGNSGGLVLEVEHIGLNRMCRVIGVISAFVPFIEQTRSIHFGTINTSVENSGYAIVEPMDRVLELI